MCETQPSRAREVAITSASKPTDPNQETLHWLRCIELGKTVYRPPFQVRTVPSCHASDTENGSRLALASSSGSEATGARLRGGGLAAGMCRGGACRCMQLISNAFCMTAFLVSVPAHTFLFRVYT